MSWPHVIYEELVSEWMARPAPAAPAEPVVVAGEQEDLTSDDHLVEQTAKVRPEDDMLPQPPQDPRWIPPTMVGPDGQPATIPGGAG